ILSVAASYISFFGVDSYYGDVRKIYVKGIPDVYYTRDAIEATLVPSVNEGISSQDIESTKTIIETRLVNNNITDYEVETNPNGSITIRLPNKSEYDSLKIFKELSAAAKVTFCEGFDNTNVLLVGSEDIKDAYATIDSNTSLPVVMIEFTEDGTKNFAALTQAYVGQTISIWMDDTMLSAPTVKSTITNGQAYIDGMPNAEEAVDLANKINAGTLPYELSVNESSLKSVVLRPSFKSYAPNVIIFAVSVIITIVCLVVAIIDTIIIIIHLIPRKKTTTIKS
ncbi:MAG: hypothetical protein IKU82_02950, partial [Clostridia bacterium]|nr:hypothetical protein [Clostridia bacterium]